MPPPSPQSPSPRSPSTGRPARDCPLQGNWRTSSPFLKSAVQRERLHMISVVFDARIRADHLIGFYVPDTITPGSNCSFSITVTQPDPNGGPARLLGIITFNQVIPADRHVVFSCPASYPLGIAHFVVLITVLSTAAAAANACEAREEITSQSE